ncbi:hypothetical protein [Campylobacter mucosalis]|uniref:hypothetical protein n=1 Tax=Campylobacter mucosalis TaxID=202 RepID=UPI0004D82344|nr:hypothetical protein [Campylobacter mucosalis]KEA46654.1 hypothetical protein CR66_02210 [Campylobacter mucosalis]QKF62826.1 hypothetical protein CMCT_0679 [Campylobacter mucosalis]
MIYVVCILSFVVLIMAFVIYKLYQKVNALEGLVVHLYESLDNSNDDEIVDFLTEFGKGFIRGFFS